MERLRSSTADAVVLAGPGVAQHVHAIARVRPDLPLVAIADGDEAASPTLLAVADEVLAAEATMIEVAKAINSAIARRARHRPAASDPGPAAGSPPAMPGQLQAIGRLAGGVGHEFNNLLLVIDASADILRQHLPADERLQVAFGKITEAGRRAATLTRQLLAFGRQQALFAAPVDLNGIVADVVPVLRQAMGPRVHVSTELQPDIPQVRADAGQLRDVLSNLGAIALPSMPDGGTLAVRTDACRMTEDDRSGRPWLRPGEYVRLRITNTGRGIEAGTLPHLFDPFFLPEGVAGGGGLVLSSVYGVVKQSGGYIWVESRLDQGTSVTILLPPLETAAAPEAVSARAPHTAVVRVLLVEDLDSVRDVLADLLALRGFEVVAAGSAEEALEIARAQRFDILLTDVTLPGASGPELARQIGRHAPGLPVLFMSGHPANAIDEGDLADPRAFLQKPFSATMLADRLHDLLGRRVRD